MAIDGVSVSTSLDSNKAQNLDSGTRIKDANRENEMTRVGQGSESGPAVVANFSAAAMETSRAASETSQAADDSRMESATERYEAQPEPAQEPPERSQPKIDVTV